MSEPLTVIGDKTRVSFILLFERQLPIHWITPDVSVEIWVGIFLTSKETYTDNMMIN